MDRMPHAETRQVIHDVCVPQDWRVGAHIADVVLEQRDATLDVGEILTLAVDQVVDHDNRRTLRGQLPDQLGADKARAAGDDDARTAHEECSIDIGSRISIWSSTARSIGVKRAASIEL